MTPLSNLDDLDAGWAIFMEDKPGPRGQWTQDQRWRADNPGELAKLLAYRADVTARPSLVTATGRRMIEHLDAWHEAKGSEPPPPPPGGRIIWDVDYAEGNISDWQGPSGSGYSGTTPTSRYAIEPRNGGYAAHLFLTANGNRSEFAQLVSDFELEVDRYFGDEIEFPASLDWRACGPWGTALTQWDQQGMDEVAAPYLLTLGPPSGQGLHVTIQVGLVKPGTYGAEFSNGSGGNLPNLWVIPPGQVPLAKTIQVVLRSFRTAGTNGSVEAWWKLRGEPQTAWRRSTGGTNGTGKVTGIPTLSRYPNQAPADHPTLAGSLAQKWGCYRGAVPYPIDYWHSRALIGTTFEAVAGRLL